MEQPNDGISLRAMSHPRAPWWKRWRTWFRQPSRESLETIEIEVPRGTTSLLQQLIDSEHYRTVNPNDIVVIVTPAMRDYDAKDP